MHPYTVAKGRAQATLCPFFSPYHFSIILLTPQKHTSILFIYILDRRLLLSL